MSGDRPFPWGLWAFIGFVGWIVLMFVLGTPTLAIAAPAAGVVGGWLLGGVVYLLLRLIPSSRH